MKLLLAVILLWALLTSGWTAIELAAAISGWLAGHVDILIR